MLRVESLEAKSFLDVGSRSGLFSLAARRLGARVHSFDYDPLSVACTRELKRRYFDADDAWTIDEASVLDERYVHALGEFDITYSWGVLHQTGDMWKALGMVGRTVRAEGQLMIAIYNDQGGASRRWLTVKRIYNHAPYPVRLGMVLAVGAWWETRAALIRLARRQNPLPFGDWARKNRTEACRFGTTWSIGSVVTHSRLLGQRKSLTFISNEDINYLE